MRLSYKSRRRLALLVLVAGVPLYIVAVVSVLNWLDRPPFWLELAVYAASGVAWVLPMKAVFKGIGKGNPEG